MNADMEIIPPRVFTLTGWREIAGRIDLGEVTDGVVAVLDLDQLGIGAVGDRDDDGEGLCAHRCGNPPFSTVVGSGGGGTSARLTPLPDCGGTGRG